MSEPVELLKLKWIQVKLAQMCAARRGITQSCDEPRYRNRTEVNQIVIYNSTWVVPKENDAAALHLLAMVYAFTQFAFWQSN